MEIDTASSGSSIQPIDASDILQECAGKCGKKILLFLSTANDWGDGTDGQLCIDCRAHLILSGSLPKARRQ